MKVKYSQRFKEEAQAKFGIRPAYVEQVLQGPDDVQDVQLQGANPRTISFLVRHVQGTYLDHHLLVYGERNGDTFEVASALKIPTKVLPAGQSVRPVEMIRHLTGEYGLYMRVGALREKFIFSQTTAHDSSPLAQAENPENHSCAMECLVQLRDEGNGKIVRDCALGYCLDLDLYKKAIS
jgi:hypothetical protein